MMYDPPDEAALAAVDAIKQGVKAYPYREAGVYITRNWLGKYGYTNAIAGEDTYIPGSQWDKIKPVLWKPVAMLHFHPPTGTLSVTRSDGDVSIAHNRTGGPQYIYPQGDGQLRYWGGGESPRQTAVS